MELPFWNLIFFPGVLNKAVSDANKNSQLVFVAIVVVLVYLFMKI
jgi:hypothetical protein